MNIEILNNHGIADGTVGLIISMLESAFGSDFEVERITHIGGGIAKTTFKIVVKNHGNFLLQVWQEPKLGLTSINGPDVELLWPGGLKRVIKNTIFLESIGVRVPHIIASDVSNFDAPGIAILEYIDGMPFVEMDKDKIPDLIYSRIGDLAGRVHSCTSSKPGIIDDK